MTPQVRKMVPVDERFLSELLCATYVGHKLISNFLAQKPLDTDLLENYYNDILHTIEATALRGTLIDSALQEISEAYGARLIEILTPDEYKDIAK